MLGLPIRLTLRTHEHMEAIVKGAPKGFGSKPDTFRYDVWVRALVTIRSWNTTRKLAELSVN